MEDGSEKSIVLSTKYQTIPPRIKEMRNNMRNKRPKTDHHLHCTSLALYQNALRGEIRSIIIAAKPIDHFTPKYIVGMNNKIAHTHVHKKKRTEKKTIGNNK
jgi:hypothetical protein